MKLAVIGGAGLLGSTTAFYAGTKGIFDEIKLVDIKENVLKSHVMDMDQGLSSICKTKVFEADYSGINDCNIILITASMPETKVSSRDDYLKLNLKIVENICSQIKNVINPNTIIINASNPVDPLNLYMFKMLKIKREKIIGFNLNDTVRFKYFISEVTKKDILSVDAYCLGEHGETKVPIFSQIKCNNEEMKLSNAQKEIINLKMINWFKEYQSLDSKRTAGWTSAIGLTKILNAITNNTKEVIPCSAVLKGEYGISDVSLGIPAKISNEGIDEIIEIEISENEKKLLQKSSSKIKEMVKSII